MFAHILLIFCLMGDLHKSLVLSNRYEEAAQISRYCKWTPQFFFYEALSAFKTKRYKEADKLIDQLMMMDPPERYKQVGFSLKDEISREKIKLDDIASDMQMSKERLEIGKGGKKTQEIQKKIIAKLDEEIKKIEDEINKSTESAQSSRNDSDSPIKDSRIIDGPPPKGEISKKNLIAGGQFGKLPPKEAIKIAENIKANLPPHIIEAAEGFSKKLQNGIDQKKK